MKAKKSLGQNFLVDISVADRIVDTISPSLNDTVVEIGPGKGVLTKILANKVKTLICIEMDDLLSKKLQSKFDSNPNVTVINDNALNVDINQLITPTTEYKMIGNLPYNVASPIIRRYLTFSHKPILIAAMLQKEVADLIAAQPGKMGYLSVEFQSECSVKKLFTVGPSVFRPAPKVKSTVISLKPHDQILINQYPESRFLDMVRAGFSAPRKQIHNCLENAMNISKDKIGLALKSAKIDSKSRPQALSISDWERLYTIFYEMGIKF
ncbi:MAG: ribosomal RNA small subunit methyltransferase A [Dehalococcoidia bacterium]|nr:ribosomal RNA small subunit methyltransferase A [Dehalococcoidia bacterium]|tara:strand:+ start:460 stop:1260 length:801 start_codon:yes stop_codon:yes gene_type:complete